MLVNKGMALLKNSFLRNNNQWVIHPLLFSLYPPVAFYFSNTSQVKPGAIFLSITVLLVLNLLVWYGLGKTQVGLTRAPILVSTFLFLFFSFQHILYGIKVIVVTTPVPEYIKPWLETKTGLFFVFIFLTIVFGLFVYWILTTRRNILFVNSLLNVVASVLIVSSILFPLIGYFQQKRENSITAGDFDNYWETRLREDMQPLKPQQTVMPDIYYLILDGYGSSAVLSDFYDLDNSGFENQLEELGFYINRKAHSNYKQTNLSISSSLNFMLIQDVGPKISSENGGISVLDRMVSSNRVFTQLRQLGYKVAAYSNGYDMTDLQHEADYYLSGENSPSAFETGLINNTPLSLLFWQDAYDWHRDKIAFTFSDLPSTVNITSPKIVFAHILVPHPPFVYEADGTAIYPDRPFNIYDGTDFMSVGSMDEYVQGYREQVEFVNWNLLSSVGEIIKNAKNPPIIILQGDHGPGSMLDHHNLAKTNVDERFSILSAYYFPDGDYTALYQGMTPVNTFRVIFNKYYGTDYKMLGDHSYFSDYLQPFLFADVTTHLNK